MTNEIAKDSKNSHLDNANGVHSSERDNVVLMQGCKALICMPVTTPEIKIEAVRRLGGNVKLVGETYSETQTYAQVQNRDWVGRPVLLMHPTLM